MFRTLRKDFLLILAVAAVFLSLSYAIGFVADRSPKTNVLETAFLSGDRAPKPQSTTVRVWRKPTFEKTAVLNSKSVSAPAKMESDNNGNVFVLDWSDLRVKQFSPEGKLLKTFGEEIGKPGAFINPTGFALDASGNMWVCDLKQEGIRVVKSDGSKRVVASPNPVYRMAAIGDVMFTMVTPSNSKLFETYNLSGQQLNSFGEILENQSDRGIILDGDIVADVENHGIIYGGLYVGVLGAYDAEGKQRFLVHTIDTVAQPTVLDVAHEGKKRKIDPNTTAVVLSLSVLDKEIYVLSGVQGGKVLDVYDKQDGHYLYSWELPANAQEAIVAANYIYIHNDREVTVWRYTNS